MQATFSHRVGHKFFKDKIVIPNAKVPLMDNAEDKLQTINAYKTALQDKLKVYSRSQLPFRVKFYWTLETSKPGEEDQTHGRNNHPMTIRATGSAPESLTRFVNALLDEYRIMLETIEGSGWTVSAIKEIKILLVRLSRVSAGFCEYPPAGLWSLTATI